MSLINVFISESCCDFAAALFFIFILTLFIECDKIKDVHEQIFSWLSDMAREVMLMPEFRFNMDFIPISKDFIENVMPTSNAAYVTIYIYMMYLASTNQNKSTSEIAKKLGLIESDVINAIHYWTDKKMITGSDSSYYLKKSPDEEVSAVEMKKSFDDIAEIIDGNKMLSDLCMIAQEILGKSLNNKEIETLYWFYDSLGLSPEVITMLLEYCVSMDKRNINYIEKVAITWSEKNITTMDEANAYITKKSQNSEFVTSLSQLFGIADRKLSKTEQSFFDAWQDDYNMSAEMVALAYEYCITNTSKLSFPYINQILKRWAEQGIHTIPDAEADHENHKKKNNTGPQQDLTTSTSDISEIEQQFMNSYKL